MAEKMMMMAAMGMLRVREGEDLIEEMHVKKGCSEGRGENGCKRVMSAQRARDGHDYISRRDEEEGDVNRSGVRCSSGQTCCISHKLRKSVYTPMPSSFPRLDRVAGDHLFV